MPYNWRRKWQPTPVLLPGESHGQGSLVGRGPWCRRESDMTEVTEQERDTLQYNMLTAKNLVSVYMETDHTVDPLYLFHSPLHLHCSIYCYLCQISFNTLNPTGAIGSIKGAFKIIILILLSLDWNQLNLMIICHPRRNDLCATGIMELGLICEVEYQAY